MVHSSGRTIIALALAFIILAGYPAHAMPTASSGASFATLEVEEPFVDVPVGFWAYDYIYNVRNAGLLSGIGDNRFGVGNPLSRAEFVTYLCKLLELELSTPASPSFQDVSADSWYYGFVETALAHGIIGSAASFYPTQAITREEMAVLSVKALGYDAMARRMTGVTKPFPDVESSAAYITIAKDLSLMGDTGGNLFLPNASATREQGAGIFWNLYNVVKPADGAVSAYYAIRSSDQMDAISSLDSVVYGWCRLEQNASGALALNTTASNQNEYYIPSGYEQPYGLGFGKERLLMVAVSGELANKIIADSTLRQQAALLISGAVKDGLDTGRGKLAWSGCLIDFETLKGAEARENFNTFLRSVRTGLPNAKIHVAVHPKRREGVEYYDGYDYRTIGTIADKVIIMAHDYNAKQLTESEMSRGVTSTPLAPIDEVYYALKAATDKQTGVADKSKLVLQISFSTAQWKLKDNKVINSAPYQPTYELLLQRMRAGLATAYYSTAYESPYLSFYNSDDNTQNIVWYENSRSVAAKINLAHHFGVYDLSLWRLGNIPDEPAVEAMSVLSTLLAV